MGDKKPLYNAEKALFAQINNTNVYKNQRFLTNYKSSLYPL
jgi:hypothetical protein